MSHLQSLSGLAGPLLFLKATVKKQVWVPGYTRHDGVVVQGHYAMVHFADDHDEHKILAGQGTYSQKAAHKNLTKHEWFNTLPHDHKVPILQEHATDLQDKDSTKAVLAVFKKKILAGQNPTNSEWKMYANAPEEKKIAIQEDAANAGKFSHLIEGYGKWVMDQPASKPDTGAHIASVLQKIAAHKLPESNTNYKVVNGKLDALAAAVSSASTKTILASAYGNNTYAKKIVKLANEALTALGSEHQVQISQKAGAHPALADEPASEPVIKTAKKVKAVTVKQPDPPPAPSPEVQPKADDGPKEGDTKPGADGGTLVFHDGHWHKQEKPEPPAAAAKPAPPKAVSASEVKAEPLAPAQTIAASKIEKVGKLSITTADNWINAGPQKGSNPGGLFKDKAGREWYCKFPSNPDAVMSEYLAASLYKMLGAKVPTLKLIKKDGKLGIASKWVDGLKKTSADQLAKAEGARSGFVIDAWLANWDVVGAGNDNLLLDKGGKAIRIDVGGSLAYRAQGAPKGDAFGNTVPELEAMLDASKNAPAASVFKGISEKDIRAGVNQLNKLKPSQIQELCAIAGPGTDADKAALAEKLIARRAFILKAYEKADQWDDTPVDETKIDVNPEQIHGPIDFNHHPQNNGKPLSSQKWLNDQNSLDSDALVKFAKTGNLKALKEYEYDAFDKAGKALGKKPITSHPSNHIQKQWASLVQTLQSIAYPPAETLDMPSFGIGGAIDEIAKQVGSFGPTENVTTVPAEHRLGYFMKLAQADADSVEDLATGTDWSFIKDTDPFVKQGKANYSKSSKITKSYIIGVQSSGSVNHIWSQGKKECNGYPIKEFTKAIYDDAMEVPEGAQMWRWMDDDTADRIMTKQLFSAQPGAILQNTDSMCTSFSQAWGETDAPHFCNEADKAILMRIRCAKGAKVTPSFGSGSHWGERELTTLPGARFVILSVKKGDKRHPNGIVVDCIMLPPDDGFIAQLAPEAPLQKAIIWSKSACNKQPSNPIVFLPAHSPIRRPQTI